MYRIKSYFVSCNYVKNLIKGIALVKAARIW